MVQMRHYLIPPLAISYLLWLPCSINTQQGRHMIKFLKLGCLDWTRDFLQQKCEAEGIWLDQNWCWVQDWCLKRTPPKSICEQTCKARNFCVETRRPSLAWWVGGLVAPLVGGLATRGRECASDAWTSVLAIPLSHIFSYFLISSHIFKLYTSLYCHANGVYNFRLHDVRVDCSAFRRWGPIVPGFIRQRGHPDPD